MAERVWLPGARIHGFANGFFGRDSYTCRTVEAVGIDWLVTRNDQGVPEFLALADANRITDPDDRSFCAPSSDDRWPLGRCDQY